MGEKVIRKIVQLIVTKEDWTTGSYLSDNQIGYTVKGEVKNTGLSVVRHALIVAAIVDAKTKKSYKILTKRFKLYKAADYSILPVLQPGESAPFEISVNFPPFKNLLFGKYYLRKLEDDLLVEKFEQRVFLIYDPMALDDKTQEWFKDELLEKLKLIGPKWEARYDRNNTLLGYTCTGYIKNTGYREVQHFLIEGSLRDKTGAMLIFTYDENEYAVVGQQKFDGLKPQKSSGFKINCNVPGGEILEANGWSHDRIDKSYADKEIKTRLIVSYSEEFQTRSIYRDTDEAPTVIEESRGEKKIESREESWVFDDDSNEFLVSGMLKNTGTQDAENVYVIASVVEKESQDPIVWETATETYKTLVIEKIKFLPVNEETTYALKIKIPSGKLFGKNQWTPKKIQEGITQEILEQKIDLYYKKEDVQEEGLKRFRLGNSYFQLKNYIGCIREYNEGIRLNPQEKRLYFNAALSYYKVGELSKSIDYCNKALELDESYASAYYLKGLNYHAAGNYSDALKSYTSTHQLNKEHANSIYNTGCVQIAQGRVNEGVQWIKRALAIDRSQILSHVVRDQELRHHMKHNQFADFLKTIRTEMYEKETGKL
ncbi:hypothetical protein ACFL6I_12970 [candidate division KSB1 bacterium]